MEPCAIRELLEMCVVVSARVQACLLGAQHTRLPPAVLHLDPPPVPEQGVRPCRRLPGLQVSACDNAPLHLAPAKMDMQAKAAQAPGRPPRICGAEPPHG